MNPERPSVRVAVVVERHFQPTRWEEWRFTITEVLLDEGSFGTQARVLRDDGRLRHTLHPGFELELFADQGEGYHLNLTSPAPVWFVMWRLADEDPSQALPQAVSLSYNEAGRWLDAEERVDNVPLPADLAAWLQAYTDQHYHPEPKKRRRPASFVPPDQRQ